MCAKIIGEEEKVGRRDEQRAGQIPRDEPRAKHIQGGGALGTGQRKAAANVGKPGSMGFISFLSE